MKGRILRRSDRVLESDASARPLGDCRLLHDTFPMIGIDAVNDANVLIDAGTGAYSRALFMHCLAHEWRRAKRAGQLAFSALVVATDGHRSCLRSLGYEVAVARMGQLLDVISHTLFRPADTVGRYGADAFVVMLPDTDVHGAVCVAERVRLAMLARDLPATARRTPSLTASVGCAVASPQDAGHDPHDLLLRASRASRDARLAGGNRCVIDPRLP